MGRRRTVRAGEIRRRPRVAQDSRPLRGRGSRIAAFVSAPAMFWDLAGVVRWGSLMAR